jgi:general secretion pathway protein K
MALVILKKKLRGMALLLVMISLALMTSVVADLSYNETIRYKIALNERDALKAEALAEGALNIGRLFLIIQGKIQPYIAAFAGFGVPLPAYTLWEMMPLNTDTFKGLTSGDLASSFGLEVNEALDKRREKKQEEDNKKKEEKDASRETFSPPEGGFGAFEGTFKIITEDEESKISLRSWASDVDAQKRLTTQKLLAALMAPKRYDDLFSGRGAKGSMVDRPSLIANIFDYIDVDEVRVDAYGLATDWNHGTGGSERSPYASDKNIVPKNAYFDSFEELRLIHGMTDDHMRAFGDGISIYGNAGNINILSAKDQVIEALIYFCAGNSQDPLLQNVIFIDETTKGWHDYQAQGLGAVSPQGFMSFLQTRGMKVDVASCASVLDVKSTNFKLTATATVNNIKRTLTLITRVVDNTEDKYYFRNN